jgi:hypothetical protein
MTTINDGGPAFNCTKCGVQFEPKAWQITGRRR